MAAVGVGVFGRAGHLIKAILQTAYLPAPAEAKHREMLSSAVLNMRISKALLAVAQSASPVTIPV